MSAKLLYTFLIVLQVSLQDVVKCDYDGFSWSISNLNVELTVDDSDQLRWSLIYDGEIVSAKTELPSFQLSPSALFSYNQVSWDCQLGDNNSTVLIIRQLVGVLSPQWNYEAPDQLLQIERRFQVYPNQAFVRIKSYIKNLGPESVTISQCQLLTMSPQINNSMFHFFHVEQWDDIYRSQRLVSQDVQIVSGKTPMIFRMGSHPSQFYGPSSIAWFAVQPDTPTPQRIEFNGKMVLEASLTAVNSRSSIVAQIERINHTITVNSTFEWPGFFIGGFTGDWDESGYVTQRFAESVISLPIPDDNYPYVQYDSWSYGVEGNNETVQMAALDVAIELGLEVFVLDLGWATQIGDWVVDPVKYPNGLKPLVDKAHSHGIKVGLHLPISQADMLAPVLQKYPEWMAYPGNTDYFGATAICLGHEPVQDWIIQSVLFMIDHYNIDYIVQDGEDMIKKCEMTDHTHNYNDYNYANSVQGLDLVLETIHELRPHIIFENCEDGGTMLTYKVPQLYHTTISADDSISYWTRQGIYSISYPFSPRYSARYCQDPISAYTLRSHFMGGPLIFQQMLTEWDENTIDYVKSFIGTYKKYRKMIRDAKIIHLIPPTSIPPYPIGWDAIQAVSQTQEESIIVIFREYLDVNTTTIYPRGLNTAFIYSVFFQDSQETVIKSGQELQLNGFNVSLPEHSSEFIIINKT